MPRTKAKKIQIGTKSLTYGKQVEAMLDSNDLYDKKDFISLRRRLEEEGYLWIRGIIPKNIIMKARNAMLTQAHKENSIIINKKSSLNDARMFRKGSKWSEGYCIDGITGSETNERNNININAWEDIGPSNICQAVYNGVHIRTFWKLLFGEKATKPLVKQTFLRLMGSSGTVQHADYYYFKRDTHIFSGHDGLNAQHAAKQYLSSQNMWKPDTYEVKGYNNDRREKGNIDDMDEKDSDILVCNVCESIYLKSELDAARRNRINKALNSKKGDFGMEGEWHCPICASLPLSIYTTWISLSELNAPRDSILAMVPRSHLLKQWDLPLNNAQLPGDFNWKLKWVIPKHVDYGDIIIFNIKTIHASSLNVSSPRSFRCSFDTRLQLMPIKKIYKKSVRKSKNKKIMPSPHPGLKFKVIVDDKHNDEDD
eukprot:751949_1